MSVPLVLDAAGLDGLARRNSAVLAYLAEAHRRERAVLVPAIVCAEVCRGTQRTRRVESVLASHDRSRGEWPPVRVVPTDFALARQVGAVLHATGADTTDIVDAHVVAVCVPYGGGVVLTSDPTDIDRFAEAVPAVRIIAQRI